MPLYFFHANSQSGRTNDLEGTEYPDLAYARDQAMLSAKVLVAEFLKEGLPLAEAVDRSIEIVDEQGNVLSTVPFSEAVNADLRGVALREERATTPIS